MKTEDLIGLLAAGETRVAPHLVRQRFAAAMGWSIPLAALVMVIVYGLRSDLVQALSGTVFWMKLAFAGALALFAGLATDRLGRPGMRVAGVWAGLAAPVVLLWLAAAAALLGADPAELRLSTSMAKRTPSFSATAWPSSIIRRQSALSSCSAAAGGHAPSTSL